MPEVPAFDLLSPNLILDAVESVFDLNLTSVVTPYSSYINRVYGLEADDGERYVVKFYRPGRWSSDTILDEHKFILECADRELPVVAPLKNAAGTTLQLVRGEPDFEDDDDPDSQPEPGAETSFYFALYPSRGGRQFDAEGDEDWVRLGSIVSRLHTVGREHEAQYRPKYTPGETTDLQLSDLRNEGVVYPDVVDEFFAIARAVRDAITPLFDAVRLQRIHGDCHRGNILDRPGEGLLLIDFDDMLMGPAVQDIWLLLPDYADASYSELELILEGYEQFAPFDRRTLRLVEPLRFMRMIHYLSWAAKQRHDSRFQSLFPDWGSRAFWIKEVEDLRVQEGVIANAIRETLSE